MKQLSNQILRCLMFIAVVSLICVSGAYAVNGSIILQPVDMHFELVDGTLPTVANVESMVFHGIEYRNTNDNDTDGNISVGDTARIDGVLSIASFMANGAQINPPGFKFTWEMTGTYVALQDTIVQIGGAISYVTTPNVGILTLYVSTDMTKPSNLLTGDGFDDGIIVGQFLVFQGAGSYLISGALDGGRDFFALKQQGGLANFFNPDIQVVSFDSNLDADTDNNLIGGDDPIPTSWNYPTATPPVNFPLSYYVTVDGSLRFGSLPECCIDIEKEVSLSLDNPQWRDADTCSELAPVTSPHGAMYRLIVTNCGDVALNDVLINDPTLGISNRNIGTLAPQGQTGDSKTLTGSDISQLGWDDERCVGTEVINNTASATGTCADPVGGTKSDQDSACWQCQELVGGCRMTGGHNKFYADGTSETVPYEAETYKVTPVQVKKGKSFATQNQVTWYTLGGQIGAPQAGCLNGPDPKQPFGDWEHNHHAGSVSWPASSQDSLSWPAGTFSGGFAFHSGTAAGPDDAYIKCITCADPGWCTQARCAPFKQIFWEGTGVFHNIDAGTSFPSCTPQVPGKNKPGTIHYYRAHVGDFGEPAGSNEQQNPPGQCGWTSAGVSILDGVLNGVTVLPWPLDAKFGDKGGQDCSAYPGCTQCGSCPDWYEIEIHCTADPSSPIIYKVGNFITHGNHQIHPEVGQQCPL